MNNSTVGIVTVLGAVAAALSIYTWWEDRKDKLTAVPYKGNPGIVPPTQNMIARYCNSPARFTFKRSTDGKEIQMTVQAALKANKIIGANLPRYLPTTAEGLNMYQGCQQWTVS